MIPGEILTSGGPIEVNAGLLATTLNITNTGAVPVHLTSHFHIFEANPKMKFDRLKAYGMRLDTHSKGTVRFEPGETKSISLVPIGGDRIVRGFNGAINGRLDAIDRQAALALLVRRGFLHEEND